MVVKDTGADDVGPTELAADEMRARGRFPHSDVFRTCAGMATPNMPDELMAEQA